MFIIDPHRAHKAAKPEKPEAGVPPVARPTPFVSRPTLLGYAPLVEVVAEAAVPLWAIPSENQYCAPMAVVVAQLVVVVMAVPFLDSHHRHSLSCALNRYTWQQMLATRDCEYIIQTHNCLHASKHTIVHKHHKQTTYIHINNTIVITMLCVPEAHRLVVALEVRVVFADALSGLLLTGEVHERASVLMITTIHTIGTHNC